MKARVWCENIWLRLGLVLGGGALYVVVINAMIALLPAPAQGDFRSSIDTVLDLSLPLLAGVVGVIVGYARGSARTESTSDQAQSRRLPARFTLTILGIELLTWGLFAWISMVGRGNFYLSTLSGSFVSPAFAAWLLVGLSVLVAVLVAARPAPFNRR